MSGENYLEKHTGLILVVATATLSIASLAHAETAAVLPSADYVTALTDSGLVRGKLSDDGDVEIYQGIPYAAPPVANLRWAPPSLLPTGPGPEMHLSREVHARKQAGSPASTRTVCT
jgi:hypothetical protein